MLFKISLSILKKEEHIVYTLSFLYLKKKISIRTRFFIYEEIRPTLCK